MLKNVGLVVLLGILAGCTSPGGQPSFSLEALTPRGEMVEPNELLLPVASPPHGHEDMGITWVYASLKFAW